MPGVSQLSQAIQQAVAEAREELRQNLQASNAKAKQADSWDAPHEMPLERVVMKLEHPGGLLRGHAGNSSSPMFLALFSHTWISGAFI